MSSKKPSSRPSSKPSTAVVDRTSVSSSSASRLLKRDQPGSSHRPAGTALRPNLDTNMATRQLKYESLSPQDRQEQEKWAQKQLAKNTCEMGFKWAREVGGYRCNPPEDLGEGSHFVTDELLAQGTGRQYRKLIFQDSFVGSLLLPDDSLWSGPYPKPDRPQRTREDARKVRIDSTGQIWETYGIRWLVDDGETPDSQGWRNDIWKRV